MFAKIQSYFAGLNTTLSSLLLVTLSLVICQRYQTEILSKIAIITQLLPIALAGTALFAAQFNHSRITLISSLWLTLFATEQWQLPWHIWLNQNANWLLLTTTGLLLLISPIKDRGLISIHGFIRLIAITVTAALCYGWLKLNSQYLSTIDIKQLEIIKPYITDEIPLVLMAISLLWLSLRKRCLTRAAMLTTAIAYYLLTIKLIKLDTTLLITIFVIHYLLVVIIDSYLLAYRDDLTSLPSRRALNQLALSLGSKYSVAMMDIDHFKKFNDTYGHDIGDQVLKLVASKLSKIKGGGKVFRYGGEEFTVVFPRKSVEQTLEHLEQLRQTIADYKMVVRQAVRQSKNARGKGPATKEKTVSVTISIGVAQRQPKQNFEQTLKQADIALYQAKKNGRNNVSHS